MLPVGISYRQFLLQHVFSQECGFYMSGNVVFTPLDM